SEVMHSTRLAVVDREGRLRGYGDGLQDFAMDPTGEMFGEGLRRLRARVTALLREDAPSFGFPELNASLNALATVLLIGGYAALRRCWVRLHMACMLTALVVSTAFLTCYLYYHIVIQKGQPTSFAKAVPEAPDWVRQVYYTVLGTHIPLAMLTVPLAL